MLYQYTQFGLILKMSPSIAAAADCIHHFDGTNGLNQNQDCHTFFMSSIVVHISGMLFCRTSKIMPSYPVASVLYVNTLRLDCCELLSLMYVNSMYSQISCSK